MKTRILTRADVAELAHIAETVEAVEGAFVAHAQGRTQMPPKVYLTLSEQGGDFRAMPSWLGDAAGLKWVNSHPNNPARHGLPAVMGVYVLSDPATGFPLAILDGTLLTALRTGAAAAVASRHLVAGAPRTIGLLGCGVQARFILAAHRAVYGDAFEVLCADARPEAAAALAAEALAAGLAARAVSAEEAAGADVVNTATPGASVAVHADWVRSNAHLNAMGADAPGKQELESSLVVRAQVVIDEREQATHSGEINVPLSEGVISESDLAGTLGQIILGQAVVDKSRLTIFDSTGLAVQDLAVAKMVFDRAAAADAGRTIDLVGLGDRD